LRGPFNIEARRQAGFSEAELESLVATWYIADQIGSAKPVPIGLHGMFFLLNILG
jgi:hypothetical protein